MTERHEIIRQMLEMQRKFIGVEQKGGFVVSEYYAADSELANYKVQYNDLATRLVDLAHAEKGSHR